MSAVTPPPRYRRIGNVSPFMTNRQLRVKLTNHERSIYQPTHHEEAQINDDDERQEVGDQLTILRKKHDTIKETNQRKKNEYDRIMQEIAQMETEGAQAAQKNVELLKRQEHLENQIVVTQARHEQELDNKKVYEHVTDRMKKNKLTREIQANRDTSKLRQLASTVKIEKGKNQRINEEKHQSKLLLAELKRNIDVDQKRKDEVVFKMEKSMAKKQETTLRREERQRKQAEIIEAAANEEVSSNENRVKEQYFLHKFWLEYLKRRHAAEQKRSAQVESVFQRIKIATGVSDMTEIVNQYLTRDITAIQLADEVAKAEDNLDTLKLRHTEIKQKYDELFITTNEALDQESIHDIKEQIESKKKVKQEAAEKEEALVLLYDKIIEWGDKILKKLSGNTEETSLDIAPASDIASSNNNLQDLFNLLINKMQESIQSVSGKKDLGLKIENASAKNTENLVRDISTNDFMSKNMRINPDLQESLEDEFYVEPIAMSSATLEAMGEMKDERIKMKQENRELYELNKKKQNRYYR